ncbi:MAG: hypothetical protein R3A13_03735 [Bdellovibrionota bacterium]
MAELSTGGNQRDIERVSSSKDSIRGRVSADFLDQRFSISDEASFEGQVELPVLGTTVSRHCREIVRNYHDGDSIQYGRKVQLGVFLRTHATTLKGDFPEDEKSIACFILELAKVYPGSAAFKSLQLLTDDKEVARVITAYADQILARFKKESDLSKISLEKVVAAVIEYASKFGVKTEVGKESSLKEKLAELKKKENLKIILQQRGDGFYRRVNITYHGFNLVSEDDGVLLVSDDAVWKERQNRKNLGQAIGQHLNVFGKFEKIFVFVQLKQYDRSRMFR